MGIRKSAFDKKFGDQFLATVPREPGVYQMLSADGLTLYVGKAKNLRRRLGQYKNARRCKAHLKMRDILKAAHSIALTPCSSELEALLLENKLIQELRPPFNISGAFSFLYPCIGVLRNGKELVLCYTTSPGEFQDFEFYGAYRSRHITREAFYALAEVLEYIGHREPAKKLSVFPRVKFSSLAAYRQVDNPWFDALDLFLRGVSPGFLEQAVLALVEKPQARKNPEAIQELLNQLKRFYRFEAKKLRAAMSAAGIEGRSISQAERDGIFLKSKFTDKRTRGAARPS